MLRHRSPFDGHQTGERPTTSGHIGVRLTAGTVPGLLQIATWSSGVAALRATLAGALGVTTVPVRTGEVVSVSAGLLLCTGPQEYQLLTSQGASPVAELRRHVGADIGAVTDLDHARCRIHIEGPDCRATLSKLFALDLREAVWPVGELRLTGHHHVPCTALRQAVDSFDLLVFSTYAFDQLATLLDAAQEYGVALESAAESPQPAATSTRQS